MHEPLIIDQNLKKNYHRYSNANCFSRTFFSWAFEVIKLSSQKSLTCETLGKLRGNYLSKKYIHDLKTIWEKKRYKSIKSFALLKAVFRTNIVQFFYFLLLSLFDSVIKIFMLPTFRLYIRSFQPKETTTAQGESQAIDEGFSQYQIGIFYLSLLFIDMFLIRMLNEYQNHLGYKTSSQINCLIFEKILKISPASNVKYSVQSGTIINNMTIDSNKITQIILTSPQLLISPFFVAAYCALLFKFFGFSFIFGFGNLIFFFIINIYFQKKVKALQKGKMGIKDQRMRLTTEALNNIKELKLYAWEDEYIKRIGKVREEELKNYETRFKMSTINFTLSWLAPVMTSIISIGAYQYFNETLQIEDVFTCLGIFRGLQAPMQAIPNFWNNFNGMCVSLKRIESVLFEKEINRKSMTRNDKETAERGIAIKIENGEYYYKSQFARKEKRSSKKLQLKNQKEKQQQPQGKDTKTLQRKSTTKRIKEFSHGNDQDIPLDDDLVLPVAELSTYEQVKEIQSRANSKLEEELKVNMMNKNPVLSDINITIKKGEFVCILGDVGSGKSSLVKAMLNNLHTKITDYKLIVNGQVAYMSQTAWIQNSTIKNNIIFFNEENEEKYQKVIDLCELKQDIDSFLGKDMTEIGEKGLNLSGGQKTRINLARALYSDRDIYILDDPFASLDQNVGMKIMKNCLLNYLKGKTRILVTHAMQLSAYADRIIYMNNGEIEWEGKYVQFKQQPFFSVILDQNTFAKKDLNKGNTIYNQLEVIEETDYELKTDDLIKKATTSSSSVGKVKRLTQDEEKEEGYIKPYVYKAYYAYVGGALILFTIIFIQICLKALSASSNIFLGYWTDHQRRASNKFYFIIYSLFGLFGCIFTYGLLKTKAIGSISISRKLHSEMISSLLNAPVPSYLETIPKGQIFNRLSKDINYIDLFSMNLITNVLTNSIGFVSSIIVCSLYQPYCLLFLPMISYCGVKIALFYGNCSRELSRLEGIVRSPLINVINETIPGLITIRSYEYEKKYMAIFFNRVDDVFKVRICLNGTLQWFNLVLDMISFCFVAALMAYTTVFKNNFTPKDIGILLIYSQSLGNSLFKGLKVITSFQNSMVALERCLHYTKCPKERPKELPKDNELRNWPSEGNVKFVNFSVKYRHDTEVVLSNLNFEVKGHEKIGVVGRTGSGKSTLSLCLFRILESLTGKILIDDVDISTIGLTKLRANLTIIPQDPMLMEGTLRYNIDPLYTVKDEEIKEVMKSINLNYLLDNDPLGLNQPIVEGGNNLSVGERQLLCIARAILRKTKIVIIDEATSSIDYNTEEMIHNAFNSMMKETTMFIIAHRIKTIIKSDRILVLDKGCVKEFNTPDALLMNKKSWFYQLYSNIAFEE